MCYKSFFRFSYFSFECVEYVVDLEYEWHLMLSLFKTLGKRAKHEIQATHSNKNMHMSQIYIFLTLI